MNATKQQDQQERGNRKTRIGVVVSNKMAKTVVVRVERRVADAKYGRIVKRALNFKAHDEENACKPGDRVRIVETRPLSKDKRWRVVETIEKATEI
jgi:small subunit ribosomal protein S17